MRRLHAETMLDAIKVSGNPHMTSGRLFDQKLARESPTKGSFKWAQQFAIEGKLSTIEKEKRRRKVMSAERAKEDALIDLASEL